MDIKSESKYSGFLNKEDIKVKNSLSELISNAPIPPEELLYNIPLFCDRRIISRILFINEIYQHIVKLHGNIFEFGVRYGQNLALFTSLRGIYEPFNHNRRIVGFDTFSGFTEINTDKDGKLFKSGDYSVPLGYEVFLESVLQTHEKMAPVESIKKFQLVKGDVSITLPLYLEEHPETIISLAYFDMDVYKPTRDCLELIKPYITKGTCIAFDELNDFNWPGETIALREVFGTHNFRLQHSAFRSTAAYLIFE
ncbi:MAG: hypothetical protein ABI760_03020 [Ferruginibacter sp.]